MSLPNNLNEKDKYLSLGTYRVNAEVKHTPVWFTHNKGKLYIFTDANSWKVKRIMKNPQVEFTSCNNSGGNLGELRPGEARIMDEADFKDVEKLFKKKYGIMFSFFKLMGKFRKAVNTYIEIRTIS
ncbi:MAG: PPOX class F420-dependent oxidoreductase [Candidatus Heimdallarchaeota archaeon]|nr:PPOX class F420-dependent oxidoreductase [Candidatus Heimdallarchaeota archaeon]